MASQVSTARDRGTLAVTKLIQEFASKVSDYLMPSITYVGPDSKIADELEKTVTWLDRRETLEAISSEVLVLKGLPENFLEIEDTIPKNSMLIIVVDDQRPFSKVVIDTLKKRVAVTLKNPTSEQLIWMIEAVLTLKESMYSTGADQKLFTVDPGYRLVISNCIRSLVAQEQLIISSDDENEISELKEFLFAPMPKNIKPRKIGNVRDIPARRNKNKYLSLDCDDKSINQLYSLLEKDRSDAVHGKKFIVFHCGAELKAPEVGKVKLYRAPPYSSRHSDRLLREFAESLSESHEQLQYDATLHAKEIEVLIETYKRMSLSAIIYEAESAALLELKRKAKKVRAVVKAAGISEPTYHKRISRFKESKSVMSINRS